MIMSCLACVVKWGVQC